MSTVKHKYRCIRFLIALGALLAPSLLHAQDSFWSVTQSASVEIIPLNASIQNDSVTLHWKILVSDIHVRSTYSHVLVPILMGANHSFSLPQVFISGRKRASYDRRERALDPFQRKPYSVSVYRRRRPVEPIYYSVSFPYSSWMAHCALELRQLSESANHSTLLSSDRLCSDFLQGREAEVATPPITRQDTIRTVAINAPTVAVLAPADTLRVALFLAYPAGFSGINALFSNNANELAKVDRLLLPLLNAPHLRIHCIRVTGYCSPEGVYADNEQLARKRAQEFVRYLRAAYPLPAATTVRTAWVAEDWQGLRDYLERSNLPWRNRALDIIDYTGIFEGRERELMKLDGGDLYRTLKQTIFPRLRRIELEVTSCELPACN